MAGNIDRDAFIKLLADRFPAIFANIDECQAGLLHCEMGEIARATQRAISAEDVAAVREHFRFIDDVYRSGNAQIKNTVHVSYLEHLSFDGRHGRRIKAREMLSPALQAALKGLEEYNAENFGRRDVRNEGRPSS
jgi:hypothetical protein